LAAAAKSAKRQRGESQRGSDVLFGEEEGEAGGEEEEDEEPRRASGEMSRPGSSRGRGRGGDTVKVTGASVFRELVAVRPRARLLVR
jgi:hypothetical protein